MEFLLALVDVSVALAGLGHGRVVVSENQNNNITAGTDYTQALTATIEW